MRGEITQLQVFDSKLEETHIDRAFNDITFRLSEHGRLIQGWWGYRLQKDVTRQIPSKLKERPCEQGDSLLHCPEAEGTQHIHVYST